MNATTENICSCGRPTTGYVCDDCADHLADVLGDVTWRDEQLEITATRAAGIDYRTLGGTPSNEIPSPLHWGAAEARSHLRHTLAKWVRYCNNTNVRNSSPHLEQPRDNCPSLAAWLLWRVDGLALSESGPAALHDITRASAATDKHIFRPPERQYLGACDVTDCDAGRLYSEKGQLLAECSDCGVRVEATMLRAKLIAELEDRLCTAAEIAHLSTYLGLRSGREQVRNRINQWHTRKQIESSLGFSGEAVFRFGSVHKMLERSEDEGRVGA